MNGIESVSFLRPGWDRSDTVSVSGDCKGLDEEEEAVVQLGQERTLMHPLDLESKVFSLLVLNGQCPTEIWCTIWTHTGLTIHAWRVGCIYDGGGALQNCFLYTSCAHFEPGRLCSWSLMTFSSPDWIIATCCTWGYSWRLSGSFSRPRRQDVGSYRCISTWTTAFPRTSACSIGRVRSRFLLLNFVILWNLGSMHLQWLFFKLQMRLVEMHTLHSSFLQFSFYLLFLLWLHWFLVLYGADRVYFGCCL